MENNEISGRSTNWFSRTISVIGSFGLILSLIIFGLYCFWIYEVYEIYNTEVTGTSAAEEIAKSAAHAMAAFQAAILTFIILFIVLRYRKVL